MNTVLEKRQMGSHILEKNCAVLLVTHYTTLQA
jgi:hypothetical protein